LGSKHPRFLTHVFAGSQRKKRNSAENSAAIRPYGAKQIPGMLEGHYTAETKFPPNDHRSHRPRAWLLNGVRKVEQLRFLERSNRTLGQAALLWLLKDQRIASTLPNIYDEKQLAEFAASSECPELADDEIERIAALYDANFGIQDDEPPKFKGTMELAETGTR
jgi:aryl-alcohol dehydrogenase-like predicted oxidoreductase